MKNDWPSLMVHLKVAANSEGETLQRSLTAAAVGEDSSVRRCGAAPRQAIGQALARALFRTCRTFSSVKCADPMGGAAEQRRRRRFADFQCAVVNLRRADYVAVNRLHSATPPLVLLTCSALLSGTADDLEPGRKKK